MKPAWLVLAVAVASVVTLGGQNEKTPVPAPVPVFMKSADANGFTDPSKDRQDSIKDLTKKVKNSKALLLVDNEEDAVTVLEMLARDTKREANGWTALYGSKQNRSVITVRLQAGDYSTEFTGESGSKGVMTGYGDAAGKVVKQLEEWVKVNRDKLAAMKK